MINTIHLFLKRHFRVFCISILSTLSLFFLLCFSANAQYTIVGQSPTVVGNTYTYSCTRASGAWPTGTGTTWSSTWGAGTITSQWIDASDKRIAYATVTWTKPYAGDETYNLAVSAGTVSGTATIIVNCNTIAAPTFSVSPSSVVCQPTAFTISASGPSGTSIRWYNNSTDTSPFTTAASYATGTLSASKTYYIAAYNSTSTCSSSKVSVPLTIQAAPAVPTAPTFYFETLICGTSGSAQIMATPTGGGDVVRWYSNSTGGSPIFTGTAFNTPVLSAQTTYYITSYKSGACAVESSPRTPVVVNLYPIPAIPSVNNQSVCGITAVTLTGTPGANGSNVYWYNSSDIYIGSGNNFSAGTVSATSTFYARTISSANGMGCFSTKTPVTITVTPLDPAPAPASLTFNEHEPMNLTTTGYPSGGSMNWYDNNGQFLFKGIVYLVNLPFGSYTYQVKSLGAGGVCESSQYSLVTLNVQQNYNWIKETTVAVDGKKTKSDVDALSEPAKRNIKWNYFDGLGRPMQSVSAEGSPLGMDIVQHIAYDGFGRESKKYLPYVSNQSSGKYKLYVATEQNSYFQVGGVIAKDASPFSETRFEASPLDRPLEQGSMGVDWQPDATDSYTSSDHTVKFNYDLNVATDSVLNWTYTNPSTAYPLGLVNASTGATPIFYNNSLLTKAKTKDEQNNEVIEFKDNEDKIILKKVQVGVNKWAQTYYIYNDFNELVCVIQPEGVKAILKTTSDYFNQTDAVKELFLQQWSFRYTYDTRHRTSMKQVPGAATVYMIYDGRDRLVFTQDGNQRANKYWSFTKYDMLNRPVLTGIYQADSVLLQSKMQRRVNAFYAAIPGNGGAWFESYSGATTVHGYDNKSYPQETTADNYLSVTYYDNYTFRNNWPGTYKYANDGLTATVSTVTYNQFVTENQQVVGQVTGSKIKVLDGGVRGGYTWLRSVNYYDDKYRVIQTQTDNYKGGKDKVSNLYDFVGKVLKSKETHTVTTWTDLVGVKQDGNKVIRTASGSGWGTSGAASVQQLGAGQDGWVEFVASELVDYRLLGLSAINADAGYTSIDYAWDLGPSNTAYIFEKGANRGQFSYSLGDVFRIERVGTTISYYQNNVFRFSSTVPSSSSLIVDLSFNNVNAELVNIRTSFTNAARTITRSFDYDHTGRLLRTWHQVDDSGTNYLLSKNNYNELGQLIDKKLHSVQSDASDNKQSVDYRYNIRGWLTSMNNSQLADDHTTTNTNDDMGDLFGMNLLYNTDDNTSLGSTGLFNGNISGIKWSVGLGQGNTKELGYNFSYDAMNRLTAANSRMNKATWQAGYYDETIPLYDLNGNIKNLTRKGDNNLQIDNLTYYYGTNGNQLQYVQDNTSSTTDKLKGFTDGNAGTAIDYTYDANGNLTRDLNKGIGTTTADATNIITYNFLNLPETVTKAGNTIRYIYDASGRKLAQVVSFVNTRKQTDYVGEFQYENDVLQFINHEEGRIAMSGTKLIYSNSFTALNSDITTTASATAATYSNNGENYIKVITSTASNGLSQIGNASTYTVQPGDRYRIRLKGYRTTNPAYLQITAGSTILNSPGTALPNSAVTESWIEQIVTIPSGVTTMKVGVIWGTTVAANESLYVNELEVSQLNAQAPEYQYNLKDHLGNVRLTFTTQPTVDVSLATFEDAYADAKVFKNVSTSTTYWVSKSGANNTSPGQYVMRMNNTYPAGPSKTLQVFPGDVINTEVWSYFEGASGFGTTNQTNANLILAVAAAFGGAPGGAGESGAIYNGVNSAYTTHGAPSNQGDGRPTAHLNYILFDKDYNFIDMGFQPVPSAANMTKQKIAFAPITIKEVGYIYVYLSYSGDGTNWVYFDDLKITNTKSPVIASNDYYPFGLTYNSVERENTIKNKYLFNGGSARQDDLGLNWDYTFYRTYDPAIGTFRQIDPKVDNFYEWTPYNYAYDDPAKNNDPNGDCPWCVGALIGAATEYGMQVAVNLVEGKSLGDALTEIDGQAILTSAALGALTSGASALTKSIGINATKAATKQVAKSALEKTLEKAVKMTPKLKSLISKAERLSQKNRDGKDITPAGKKVTKEINKEVNEGKMKCEECGMTVKDAPQSQKGVSTPKDAANVDHYDPKANNGSGNPTNARVTCVGCNNKKSDKIPDDVH